VRRSDKCRALSALCRADLPSAQCRLVARKLKGLTDLVPVTPVSPVQATRSRQFGGPQRADADLLLLARSGARSSSALLAEIERLRRLPGLAVTVSRGQIKAGYHSIKTLNPRRIVPAGPESVAMQLRTAQQA
jgi:glutathionyl-hydroquinone reductase